ncbi:hypothetical protein AB0J80_11205 [Actinoplanes sp. NPDC049548]|uniref:hypothetical protein n=1 Tax=Actinoplanes sp. NPDC049548 TaxID=3155152 RepID=UPI0034403824
MTDGAVFAYLGDPDLRRRGWRFLLVTKTAQHVYAPLGFTPVDAARWMICDPTAS